MAIATTGGERQVLERLSTVDRFLPLWITLAMAAGLGLGSSKVRYERLGDLRGDRGLFSASLFLNWVVGPACARLPGPSCRTSRSTAPA